MANTPRIDRLDKNYIINGNMDFFQRSINRVAAANATLTADRFKYNKAGAMVHTITRSSDVPDSLSPYSLSHELTTADTTIAASDVCVIQHPIEGFFFKPIAGKECRLSFWVKAGVVGIYSVGLRNSAADRSCVLEYTINTINTWEFKSLLIPASPVGGTWNYGTGAGVYIDWVLAAGTDFRTATLNQWQSANVFASVNQINGVNTGSGTFKIAQVMLCEGADQKSGFVSAGRNHADELLLCQRYFEKSYDLETAISTAGANGNHWSQQHTAYYLSCGAVDFTTQKRITATIVYYSLQNGAVGTGAEYNPGATFISNRSLTSVTVGQRGFTAGSGDGTFIAGNYNRFHWTADAEI